MFFVEDQTYTKLSYLWIACLKEKKGNEIGVAVGINIYFYQRGIAEEVNVYIYQILYWPKCWFFPPIDWRKVNLPNCEWNLFKDVWWKSVYCVIYQLFPSLFYNELEHWEHWRWGDELVFKAMCEGERERDLCLTGILKLSYNQIISVWTCVAWLTYLKDAVALDSSGKWFLSRMKLWNYIVYFLDLI